MMTAMEARAIKERAREETRKKRYVKAYKMTVVEYDQLVIIQASACAICRRPPTGKSLFIDHDHRSGRVRGLVCHRCNIMLGVAQDNATVLRNAATYLDGVVDAGPLVALRAARKEATRRPEPPSFAVPCHPDTYSRQADQRKPLWLHVCSQCRKEWIVQRDKNGYFTSWPVRVEGQAERK